MLTRMEYTSIRLVRRELERVEQIADTAVVQVQDEAADFRSVQEQVEKQAKATVAYVETLQRDVESASAVLQTELQALKKKVRTIDQRVQQQATQSIDEDSLMTQLTELQERYEIELSQHKDAFLAQFLDKQQALEAVKTQIHQLSQVGRQEHEDASRATAALDTQLKSLKQHVHELDRERQASADKQGRLKGELDDLGHRVDRQLDDTKHHLQQQLQHLQDQYLKLQAQHQAHQQPMPLRHVPPPPLPPPPSFHHPSLPSDDPAIKEKLHLLGRDVHLVAEDLRRCTIRFDSRLDEAHQGFTAQLRDLRGELFAALDHDSRQHVVENKRLRDMAFDLEGTFRDGMGRMEDKLQRLDDNARRMDEHVRRIEESVRRLVVERQAPRSPPRRPLDAYPIRSSRHYEDSRSSGPSLYNDQPGMRAAPLSHVGPIVAEQRSRSRSRSNPRDRVQQPSVGCSPHRSENGITALNNRSVSPESDQRQASSQLALHAASSVQSNDVQMAVVSGAGLDTSARASERVEGDREQQQDRVPSGQEQTEHRPTAPPVRRNKKPRKPHEVIVIEDDESADDMVVAPDRAPPDVVTEDDEDSRNPRTVVIREEGDVDLTSGDDASSSDRLKRLSDLRLGSLLYFCFGGAPSLDFEWTRYFSKLNPCDCIEMSRATNFLHRYPGLHSFPIHLAQFIVQAIVVEVPLGGTQSEPLALGLSDGSLLESVDPALVTDQFHQVLNKIRLSWAETLVVKLQKMIERTQGGDPTSADLQLSVNPALIEQAGGVKKINAAAWQQQQAKSLWVLLRRPRFASTMPAFTGDMVASPGVYVFLLMFDVVQVNRLSPQSGTFRLTNWGRVLVIQLWDRLLSKLPYLLFADCSWLENQTDSSGTLPTLGFCHILSAILAWTSITDKAIESSASFYSELVRLFLDCLHVNGVRVRDTDDFVSLVMNEAGADGSVATKIELIGVDTKLVSLLQLDGFFEVADATSSQATSVVSITAIDTVEA